MARTTSREVARWLLWPIHAIVQTFRRYRHQHQSMAAYHQPPTAGSPVDRFLDGEELPIKGQKWIVAKRVGGVMPCLILTPVGPTRRRMKQTLAALRDAKRAKDDADRREKEARWNIRDELNRDRRRH